MNIDQILWIFMLGEDRDHADLERERREELLRRPKCAQKLRRKNQSPWRNAGTLARIQFKWIHQDWCQEETICKVAVITIVVLSEESLQSWVIRSKAQRSVAIIIVTAITQTLVAVIAIVISASFAAEHA